MDPNKPVASDTPVTPVGMPGTVSDTTTSMPPPADTTVPGATVPPAPAQGIPETLVVPPVGSTISEPAAQPVQPTDVPPQEEKPEGMPQV